jgi:hypothetical protein
MQYTSFSDDGRTARGVLLWPLLALVMFFVIVFAVAVSARAIVVVIVSGILSGGSLSLGLGVLYFRPYVAGRMWCAVLSISSALCVTFLTLMYMFPWGPVYCSMPVGFFVGVLGLVFIVTEKPAVDNAADTASDESSVSTAETV